MSLITVVIPAYNSERVIRECLNSVISQSHKVDEIIIINDGSTDLTGDICKEFASKSEIIKYYEQENKGVAFTRNYGICLAKSKYIMFVDSDDVLPKDSVKVLKEQAEKDYDFIMGGFALFSKQNGVFSTAHCQEYQGFISEFLASVEDYMQPPLLLGPCFKLFKREIIKNNASVIFPEDLSYGEDAIFVMEYLKHVKTVGCVDAITYLYRKDNSQSLSSRFREDKIDINMRIACLFEEMLTYHGVINVEVSVAKCRLNYFDAFTSDLMFSPLSLKEKRRIYREKAREHKAIEIYDKKEKLNFKQKVRRLAIKSSVAFFCMNILYKISGRK